MLSSIILLALFGAPLNPGEIDSPVETVTNANYSGEQDTYAVIGRTKKQYGTNYTINLRVTGSCNFGSCYVRKVEYATNYGYSQVRHQSVFGQAGTYTVYIDGETYYFDF